MDVTEYKIGDNPLTKGWTASQLDISFWDYCVTVERGEIEDPRIPHLIKRTA